MDLDVIAAAVTGSSGLEIGVLVTVFMTGLRHGFDLDHIAAITDISSSTLRKRRSLVLGTAYIIGHAAVLFLLGALAVVVGERIPPGLDSLMGRVIGFTLLALGAYVIYALIRFRRDFTLQSRWMLILAGIKRSLMWLRRWRSHEVEIEHDHPHSTAGHHHDGHPSTGLWTEPSAVRVVTKVHKHSHKHVVQVPADPFKEYGVATCVGIGMIHGVGAETPSQLLLFTTAAGVTGGLGGMALVACFVAGLMLGNTVLAVVTAAGFSKGRKLPVVYMLLAGVTATLSLAVGLSYLIDRPDLLPPFLGG